MERPKDIHEDVACTVCGCVCDDLIVRVANDRIVDVQNACPLAEPWFASLDQTCPPLATIRRMPVELSEAIVCASEILAASRAR